MKKDVLGEDLERTDKKMEGNTRDNERLGTQKWVASDDCPFQLGV